MTARALSAPRFSRPPCWSRRCTRLRAPPAPGRRPGQPSERPSRHDRHPARRPRRLLWPCGGASRRLSTASPPGASASRPRSRTRRSPVPLTPAMLTGLTPLGHGVPRQRRVRAAAVGEDGGRGLPRRPAIARPRSSRGFRSTGASASTAGSTPTTTISRAATTAGARPTSSASRTPRPTPRCAGCRAPLAGVRRHSSSGCITTIPTRPTSRPASWPAGSATRPTTARSPSWTRSSRACCGALEREGRPRAHGRPRDRRSRREPGRARRGNARPLRLRLHAAGAVDRGRTGRGRRPRARHRRPRHRRRCRRCSTTRACPSRPRSKGRSLRPAARGPRDERRARVRGDAAIPSASSAGRPCTPCARRASS